MPERLFQERDPVGQSNAELLQARRAFIRVFLNADGPTNSTGSTQAIPWDAVDVDQCMTGEPQWVAGTPTRLICRVPGLYLVSGHVVIQSNATNTRIVNIRKNGTTNIPGGRFASSANAFANARPLSGLIDLARDDYLEFLWFQDSGAGLVAQGVSSSMDTKFTMAWIGP